MSVITKDIEVSHSSRNWQKQPKAFSANDVVDAYFKGKEDGKTEQERIYRSQFDINLEKAKVISESLFKKLSTEHKFHLKAIHLKADTITSFCALFVSDAKDFLKEEFREVFVQARKYKLDNEDDTFEISFLFTPYSTSLSEYALASDGYFIKYGD